MAVASYLPLRVRTTNLNPETEVTMTFPIISQDAAVSSLFVAQGNIKHNNVS